MSAVHDVPIIGVFTKSFTDGFGGAIWEGPAEEQVHTAFDTADKAKKGKLDQNGVAAALRELEKSERQITCEVRNMDEAGVDFDQFKEIAAPKHAYVPVVGNIFNAADSFLRESMDTIFMPLCAPTPDDQALKKLFNVIDSGGTGNMDKDGLSKGLRKLWFTEAQIKDKVEQSKEGMSLYEFRQMLLGDRYYPSFIDNIPLVGPALHGHLVPYSEIPHEHIREAFDHIDTNHDGKIDKTEVGDVLRELGRSEFQIQRLVDSMPGPEMDFEAFCELYEEPDEGRASLHWVGEKVPVPNLAKIHDVPVIGKVTNVAQDLVVDTLQGTVGNYCRHFVMGGAQIEAEEAVRKQFQEFAAEHDGKLNDKQVAILLRSMGRSEYQIKFFRDQMEDKSSIELNEFEMIYWRWI
jgi:Ca2+-binding EF-hand superfamily protein